MTTPIPSRTHSTPTTIRMRPLILTARGDVPHVPGTIVSNRSCTRSGFRQYVLPNQKVRRPRTISAIPAATDGSLREPAIGKQAAEGQAARGRSGWNPQQPPVRGARRLYHQRGGE